jgi:hypothetical protein
MELEQFVDQLILEKGLETEDPEIHAQIKEDLLERVESRINAFILSNIQPQDLEEFDKILDEDSEEKTQAFIQSHIPNFDEKAATELLTFRSLYLS